MKLFLALVLSLAGFFSRGTAFAAKPKVYKLAISLTIGNQEEKRYGLVIAENSKGRIAEGLDGDKTSVEVTANQKLVGNSHTVLLQFKVEQIGKDGFAQVIGTPQIITNINQEAEIAESDESGSLNYKIKVLVRE